MPSNARRAVFLFSLLFRAFACASRRQRWTLSSCETQSGVVRRHANRSIDGPTDGYCRRRRRRRVNRIPFHDIPFRARSPDLPRVGSGVVGRRSSSRRRLVVVLFYMDKQCVFTDFLSNHSSKSNQPIPQPAPIVVVDRLRGVDVSSRPRVCVCTHARAHARHTQTEVD